VLGGTVPGQPAWPFLAGRPFFVRKAALSDNLVNHTQSLWPSEHSLW